MRILEATPARSQSWQRILMVAATALVAISLLACGSDSGEKAPAATTEVAQELTNEFITLLQKKDTSGLTDYLDQSFMIQRADGSFATKQDYLINLPTIGDFTINNVAFKQTGDSLVVRWELTVVQTINGQQYRDTPAPRLSTFVYVDDGWRMMSHANFNAPATAEAAPVN